MIGSVGGILRGIDRSITRVILASVKTAISIPDPLFQAAERLARRLGVSRSELFQRAVQSLLEKHDDASVTGALNSIYADAPDVGRLDPRLARMQSASLGREEW